MAQLDNAADSDSEERGFESLRAGQKCNSAFVVLLYFFILNQTKGFEQGGSEAEENSPVDCFCRRGQAARGAIDALHRKNPLCSTKKTNSSFLGGFVLFLLNSVCS